MEGQRDRGALRKLGYDGSLVTVSSLGRKWPEGLGGATKVVVMTDLDREGAFLASKFVKRLGHEGVATSLSERRRLKAASRGVFLHIENLGRFANPDEAVWKPSPGKAIVGGLGRFRRGSVSGRA